MATLVERTAKFLQDNGLGECVCCGAELSLVDEEDELLGFFFPTSPGRVTFYLVCQSCAERSLRGYEGFN